MRYSSEPLYQHGSTPNIGILLVNLGTPNAPTAAAVRAYLKQFLSDPRVVELPRTAWWLILNGIILNIRPRKSAQKYAKIWTDEGSPLRIHTKRQAQLLRGYLGELISSPLVVEWAMRYGDPSVAEKLWRLHEQRCDRVLIIPLYPQYAASTTASTFDAVAAALSRIRNVPALRMVKHFQDDAGYIQALAQSVNDYWTLNGRPDKLVMSFHGVPRFTLDRGDPYHCECQKTARLLAEALALKPDQHLTTFQSRFGRAEWLKPYTMETLKRLGKEKVRRVDVVCPGFVSDCLETLEEIGIENRTAFLRRGGTEFHHIPCLNERDDWIRALTSIAMENLQGWLPAGGDAQNGAQAADSSRQRALAAGARA